MGHASSSEPRPDVAQALPSSTAVIFPPSLLNVGTGRVHISLENQNLQELLPVALGADRTPGQGQDKSKEISPDVIPSLCPILGFFWFFVGFFILFFFIYFHFKIQMVAGNQKN